MINSKHIISNFKHKQLIIRLKKTCLINKIKQQNYPKLEKNTKLILFKPLEVNHELP